MNKVILTGRLTRDPKISTYGENNDKMMARYTLAVERWGKHEEGQQTADFINCVCYGGNADFCDKYLRQGTKMLVEGQIRTGKYQNKDGQTVYTTDVWIDRHEFAGAKSDGGGQAKSEAPSPDQAEAKPDTSFVNIPEGVEEELPW